MLQPRGQPRISIVTPSLNQGRFIERTINSVLDQGYPNLEYVIVDGGSTDDTVEVIRRYEKHLAWWVSEPDDGQTSAINRGIAGTSGEIVAYLNSDDYLLPGALDTVAAAFASTDCNWIAGAAMDLDEHDRPAGTPGTDADGVILPSRPQIWEHAPRGRQWWLLSPYHVPQPSAFWRRELFERYGLFLRNMHYAFDAEFMIRLVWENELPELLPDDILSVRVHHSEAKSADFRHWRPEIKYIADLYSHELTARERRRLPVVKALTGIPVLGRENGPVALFARVATRSLYLAAAFGRACRRAYGRIVTKGGDTLDYVPERIRPPIRTRDRVRRARLARVRERL